MNRAHHFPALALPEARLLTRPEPDGGDGLQVFDSLRQKWVALTPEEHVRQSFVAYLTRTLQYPAGRLGNEVSLTHNGRHRRCDTVVFAPDATPLAIIEYKAPDVTVGRATFEQIMRYSIALGNRWIIVSNGLAHYCARIDPGIPPSLTFLNAIPPYPSLLQ